MEPAATSSLVGRDPPPPTNTANLGEGEVPSGWVRRAFQQTLIFLLVFAIAWALQRAGFDPGFALVTSYFLAVLCLCLWKLELLRRDTRGDPSAAVRERRRVGLAAWAISLVWGSNAALCVAGAASSQALRVAMWVLAAITMGLGLYFLFIARCGRDASADDDGHWPEKDIHELSPEQKV